MEELLLSETYVTAIVAITSNTSIRNTARTRATAKAGITEEASEFASSIVTECIGKRVNTVGILLDTTSVTDLIADPEITDICREDRAASPLRKPELTCVIIK